MTVAGPDTDEGCIRSADACRVLHVYSGNLYGGVERALMTMHRHRGRLKRTSMEFACCFEGQLVQELRSEGAIVTDLGATRASRPWTVVRARLRLADLLRCRRYDVVVTHSGWLHALFAGTARRAGAAILFWAHDRLECRGWMNRVARRVAPDYVIANSDFTLASVPKLFGAVPRERVYLPVSVPDPALREARDGVRREMGCDSETVVILCASRLEAWKGHAVLLEALARLKSQRDWQCWIAGGAQRPHEQAYLAELESSSARLGIGDRVRFLGHRRDVHRLLAAADLHCQPNTGPEPFGVAFIEALWMGVPVVTSAMGGAIEILNGSDAGVLVPAGDADALAAELGRLIDDPARRRMMSQAGPTRAAELCEPSRQMLAIESAIHRALVSERSSP